MRKNELYIKDNEIIRIIEIREEKALVIDCICRTMPQWKDLSDLSGWDICSEETLYGITNMIVPEIDSLCPESRKKAYERYTLIAPVLRVMPDEKKRCEMIALIATSEKISKQTVRKFLCLYLTYQSVAALAPKDKTNEVFLSKDEKNMRWALNKFYYSYEKNSLQTAYTMMLKEKYCDSCGVLMAEYPTFNQFRYFYRKRKSLQTYYISRNGLTNYQRNSRPLLGDGVQEYAKAPGMGMLDATICDIYLVNGTGGVVGRPVLTACIDAYSSLCCGYTLGWEGGTYSLKGLMLNVVSDKQEFCWKHGIRIEKEEWDSSKCPGVLITDQGTEYISENFEQIAELGIKIINLPSYRPELKGVVEKFFDVIQDLFKPHLKGKGVIEPDFQERGAHDYRKDACLTLDQFERVIIKCIIYYNSQRIVENFPYTAEMLAENVPPFANKIFQYGEKLDGVNLVSIEKEQLMLTLLPRTTGRFTRTGLIVNRIRYKNKNYAEKYLSGGNATVAFNPEDSSFVWLVEKGSFIKFELIESRYKDKNFTEIEEMQSQKKNIVKSITQENLQARINLASFIETIVENAGKSGANSTKDISKNREKEKRKSHVDYMKVGELNE